MLARFSEGGKNIFKLERSCTLCAGNVGRWYGLCLTCFGDLPRCPPRNLKAYMHHEPEAVRLLLAALWYQAEVRLWLQEFKFGGRTAEAKAMATLLAAQVVTYYRQQQLKLPQYLVPVPMTRRAWARRGYNQAELLAKEVGKALGISVLLLVQRTRQIRKAHTLNAQERAEGLQQDFKLKGTGTLAYGTRLALIDDVLTTGATLEAVALAIPQAGVIIDAWTVAYTPPPKPST